MSDPQTAETTIEETEAKKSSSTELAFVSNFDALQQDFENVNQAYSNIMSTIASDVKFDSRETDEVKEKLIEFAAEQERIANYESFSEKFLRRVSNVPLIGKAARSSADSMREQRLGEESISGLVGSMYQGLKKQAEDVERTEARLIEIHENTKTNLEVMNQLSQRIEAMMQQEDIPASHRSRVMRMSTQIKVMAEKSRDKIDTLELIIPSTQACLETIYRELPISEADLLSDMAMSTGVTQINALSQDVKEMRELSEIVSTNIFAKTQKSIVNLLEMNSVSDKDIQRIENNAKQRENLYIETMKAAQKSSEQIRIAHTKIEKITEEAAQRRIDQKFRLENSMAKS